MRKTLRINTGNEIGKTVEKSLDEYFRRLDGEQPHGIYDMVINHVERALIASVMDRTGRQSDPGGRHAGDEPEHAAGQAHQVRHSLTVRAGWTAVTSRRGPRCNSPVSPCPLPSPKRFFRYRTRRASSNSRAGSRARREAPVDRRHGEGAGGGRACGHRDRRVHRLPGNARRPRQDAASESARRHPRAPRRAGACGGARAARHSADRPRRRQPLSVSRNRRAGTTARSTRRSRTSTSAARRWCARPRRTGRTSAWWSNRRTTAPLLAELAANGRALSARRDSRWRERRFRTRRPTTAPSRTGSPRAARTAPPPRFPTVSTCRRSRCRISVTARTRTSRPRSIATRGRCRGRSPRTGSSRARSCRSTISRIRDAAWECVKALGASGDAVACVIVKHANPCGAAIARSAARGLPAGVRDRSGLGLRRDHRLRSSRRRGDARGRVGAVSRGADRAGLHGGCAGGDRAEEERARAGGRAARRSPRRRSVDLKRIGGGLLLQSADARNVDACGAQGRDREGADARRRCAICCSPFASRSSSRATRSSTAATGARSASAPGR